MTEATPNRIEELGRQFLRALDPLRVQGLALVNGEADVVWLNAGAMGPDEHALVTRSLDAFTVERDRVVIDRRLEDHRRAIFLAARDPQGACCGLVFALVDARGSAEAGFAAGAHLQALLRRFSATLASKVESAEGGSTSPAGATAGTAPIHARKYARLQSGGTTRRYEVLHGDDGDELTIERVAAWLARNRSRYEQEAATFTVMITAASVDSAAFLGRVKGALQRHGIERGRIGIGLPVSAWREPAGALGRFLGECQAIGCSITLDDFSLRHDAVTLLRFPAIRCLKIDPGLSTHALTDRVAQAELAAIVQAARVLGLHCVAKNVAAAPLAKWLAALGIDFVDRLGDGKAAGTTTTTKTAEILSLDRVG